MYGFCSVMLYTVNNKLLLTMLILVVGHLSIIGCRLCWKIWQKCKGFFAVAVFSTPKLLVPFMSNCFDALIPSTPTLCAALEAMGEWHLQFLQDQDNQWIFILRKAKARRFGDPGPYLSGAFFFKWGNGIFSIIWFEIHLHFLKCMKIQ